METGMATLDTPIDEVGTLLAADLPQLQADTGFLGTVAKSGAAEDMLVALRDGGVESLPLTEGLDTPEARFVDMLERGRGAMIENGIAEPNIGGKTEELALFGLDIGGINGYRGTPVDKGPTEHWDHADWQQEGTYEVHMVSYPVAGGVAGGKHHAAIVVTERGGDPTKADDALLVMRGGPYPYDKDDPRFNDVNERGELYVDDFTESRSDLAAQTILVHDTQTVSGKSLLDIAGNMNAVREYINEEDYTYLGLNYYYDLGGGANSNTAAREIFEAATGREPNFRTDVDAPGGEIPMHMPWDSSRATPGSEVAAVHDQPNEFEEDANRGPGAIHDQPDRIEEHDSRVAAVHDQPNEFEEDANRGPAYQEDDYDYGMA